MSHCVDPNEPANLVCDLVALQTVNPMGRPYDGSVPVERPVVEHLERLFAPFDVQLERQRCSSIHESLLVTVQGRTTGPGTLFESHVDTVPADDWRERAFCPRRDGDRIFGRGACDDKGPLAAMVTALLQVLRTGEQPPQTVWLLAAGDEEYAQSGIKHFVAQHSQPVGRGIFGEPTDCVPVVQHNGAIRWDITAQGRSAHSSQPDLGRNAILEAMRLIDFLAKYQEQLRGRYRSPWVDGPCLTVTMIQGGRTRNAVPDECRMAVDFRILPGMDPNESVDELFAALESLPIALKHSEFQCFAPALNTPLDDLLVTATLDVCRDVSGQQVGPAGVPYCSDACWMPRGAPAIVLGPGNIAQAHAVDEFIDLAQVAQATAIYGALMRRDWRL